MPGVVLLLPLLVPAAAGLAARPLGDRLPPRAATWLLAGSALALAAASSAVLARLTLSAAIGVPFIAEAGQASLASMPVALAAGAALAVCVGAVSRALLLRTRAIAAAARMAHALPGAGQVVVTEDEEPDAYTLPGWPGRIVITAGMLRALSAPERQVLLAHERTHAAGAHYLFTAATRLAAAANPLLRPAAAAVAYTVERWADERAAAATGDRGLTARTIARAALAGNPGPGPGRATGAAALGLTGLPWRPARGPGPVPRRVAALLLPPPRPRLRLIAAAAALVVLSAAAALEAAWAMHQFVEQAQSLCA